MSNEAIAKQSCLRDAFDHAEAYRQGIKCSGCEMIEAALDAKDATIEALRAEVKQLTQACEGFMDSMMDSQDKACVGHIEEVRVLSAENQSLKAKLSAKQPGSI